MKKIIAIACMLAGIAAYAADGTVNFNNRVTGSVDAPIFYIDTAGAAAVKADGAGFMAQLYAGSSDANLAAVGAALPFRAGAGAGYINPTGVDTARTIPGVTAGSVASVQVRAWKVADGATYELASAAGHVGQSQILHITTGGAGDPPGLPANLVGLASFNIQAIPEPATLALGLLGAALLVIRRRK